MNVSYVFPNISKLNYEGRGGLNERWNYALRYSCDFIEVPCDFIKNKTEMKLTGLDMCSIPDQLAIERIYKKDYSSNNCIKYILHTEPMLHRMDISNKSHKAKLKWYDDIWTDKFITMIFSVIDLFKETPFAIEIHPGDRNNTYGNLYYAAVKILTKVYERYNYKPLILVENRTGQFISTCKEVSEFINLVSKQSSDLTKNINFVLDIFQLYTSTKDTFEKDLNLIPFEIIKAYHVHTYHKAPDINDALPWKSVFQRIKLNCDQVIINPEVFHEKHVRTTIDFCKEMMKK